MKVLVTGAAGQVGKAACDALSSAGHEVVATDIQTPDFTGTSGGRWWARADLVDAGEAFELVRGCDAVIHAGAIPGPGAVPATSLFRNNVVSTYNVIEACIALGVTRLVNISSETVPGFISAERPFRPAYLPVDEDHPCLPQEAYALGKYVGESICDAAVRRSDLMAISIRPSWVQTPAGYEHVLGPAMRGGGAALAFNYWSYVDVFDLADAARLAVESKVTGHEVMYIASPDNTAGRPLAQLLREHGGADIPLRSLAREDASGISCAKAGRLLGYRPTRSWRDYLQPDGSLLNS
jgi:UDP-glucose 4-epimerase